MNSIAAPSAPLPFALIAESVTTARLLEELVRPLLEVLETLTGMESTYLISIDEDAGVRHVPYSRNSRQLRIPESLAVPWTDTLCKRALDEGCQYTDDVPGTGGGPDAARATTPTRTRSSPVPTRRCTPSSGPARCRHSP